MNRRVAWPALLGALLILGGFASRGAEPAPSLRIENVSADRVAFRPGEDDPVRVAFRLSAPARVEMNVWDSRDLLVRTVRAPRSLPAGEAELAWDGRTDGGEPVPPEAYFYTLTASSPSGERVVHDVTDLTRGEDGPVSETDYDPATGTVNYVLPGPSRVGLRAGIGSGGPLLATIVDWEPRVERRNSEPWEGIEGLSTEAVIVLGEFFEFPANVIVVQPAEGSGYGRGFVAGARETRPHESGERHMYRHSEHPRDECHDFAVALEFVKGVTGERDGVPVLGPGALLQIDLPPGDREFALRQRFETVLYMDGVFLTEMEQGYVPFRWPVDSFDVPATGHVLTVNLRGYEGHFGCASIRFVKAANGSAAAPPSPAGVAVE